MASLRRPSAIGLRQVLPVQTKTISFMVEGIVHPEGRLAQAYIDLSVIDMSPGIPNPARSFG